MSIPNPIKSLAGQTLVYGMGTIVPRLLNYFLVPFYTRVFVEEAYGQITELYAYIAFLMVVLTFGMETAFFRFAQKHDKQSVFSNALSMVLLVCAAFFVLLLITFQPIAGLIHYSGTPEYILLIGIIVALDAFTAIPFAMLRKLNKARRFALIRLASVALNIGLNVLLLVVMPLKATQWSHIMFGPNAGLVVWVFLSNLVSSLLAVILLWPEIRMFRWKLEHQLVKPMLIYALPVLVVGLSGMVIEMMDKVLLKHLLPASSNPLAQLGIYGANYKLGVLMTLFIQMFRYAAEPFFFAEADKKDSRALFAQVMNYFVLSGLGIFLVVVLYLDVFKLLIGPSYREGLGIVPIVLMANLFYGVYFNLSIWYKLTDRTGDGAKISLAGALITIVLNLALIPLWGYHGAAWTHFISYFVMMAASFIWGQRVYPIPYPVMKILSYMILAAILYGVSVLIRPESVLLRLVINTFLLIIFALTAWYVEKTAMKTNPA
jgi:O-antigen/teichoic acid export membrane protein